MGGILCDALVKSLGEVGLSHAESPQHGQRGETGVFLIPLDGTCENV